MSKNKNNKNYFFLKQNKNLIKLKKFGNKIKNFFLKNNLFFCVFQFYILKFF